MANKTKATPQKDEAHEKHPETSDARQPLLDVIETEEAEADDEGAREETDSEETESGDLVEVTPTACARARSIIWRDELNDSRSSTPTTRCAYICAR